MNDILDLFRQDWNELAIPEVRDARAGTARFNITTFFWQLQRKLVWRTSIVVFSQTRFIFFWFDLLAKIFFLWNLRLTRFFFADKSALCFWKIARERMSHKEVQTRWHCPGGGAKGRSLLGNRTSLFLPACLLTPRYQKNAHRAWCGWVSFGAYCQHWGGSERTSSFEN